MTSYATTGLPFAPEDVSTLTHEVGSAVLGMALVAVDDPAPDAEPGPTACVTITGGWEGSVVLRVSEQLAAEVAATMFDLPADEIGADETADALGELANIVGGGIKGLIAGTSQLSLPTVMLGTDTRLVVPQAELVHEVAFEVGPGRIVVGLWQRPVLAVAAATAG
jgi:chemotaxis protein CheX